MSKDEEYVYYQESITSLNRAWRTICELENTKFGGAIWSAAYRMALIEYCKPFKKSYGSNNKRYSLYEPALPEPLLQLHKDIINLRDQALAHPDINILETSIYRSEKNISSLPIIVSKLYINWPSPTQIRALIEAVLDQLYDSQKHYESHYRQNP
ncbi:hypothetical protein [Nitrosomonas oligotropha]|uniref:HEPN AbiU2-like domain-containing protein n=1 Tax=Nitrosomonas oligotropha TaxID=42354 RepID=A0A1H8TNI3_9PROT|nr:hypothetical protein [Nitrosomonas oligotropha]SDX33164.1 hypothetical protein SAMN05216300_12910 [Nitrosomonas oligotropha]SEO92174.1 hypothetical protein SAMN05216333_12610 [Nitrosomonas oligotropha]